MTRKPNALQKGIQRLVMWGPLTTFFAPRIHKLDKTVLKLTRGRFTLSEILGWNIIQLTTLGAKSLQPHTMPLVGMFAGEGIGLIASSFGRKHNPAWYYNLKAHPECQVEWHGRIRTYIAREAEGEEYKRYWQLAVSYYAGYEKYRERAAHRHIPVMVLEPKE
jgi:deazaflavin-dependent oxidoreductase (nitroreductase family)